MSELKETIAEVISQHIALEDTYTYELKRDKVAFEVGTMSLEDFEEWTEENVADLAQSIVDALQPTLNENQQVVLEWLKKKSDNTNLIIFKPFEAIFSLKQTATLTTDESIILNAIDELNSKEQAQVLQVFSAWVQDQEGE